MSTIPYIRTTHTYEYTYEPVEIYTGLLHHILSITASKEQLPSPASNQLEVLSIVFIISLLDILVTLLFCLITGYEPLLGDTLSHT